MYLEFVDAAFHVSNARVLLPSLKPLQFRKHTVQPGHDLSKVIGQLVMISVCAVILAVSLRSSLEKLPSLDYS